MAPTLAAAPAARGVSPVDAASRTRDVAAAAIPARAASTRYPPQRGVTRNFARTAAVVAVERANDGMEAGMTPMRFERVHRRIAAAFAALVAAGLATAA